MNEEIGIIGFSDFQISMISEFYLSENKNVKFNILDNLHLRTEDFFLLETDFEFHSNIENFPLSNLVFALANPQPKRKLFQQLKLQHEDFISLIHPTSQISPYSTHGYGFRLDPQSYVAPKTKIGNQVYINRNCSVGHHCEIKDFVSIFNGSNVSGHCIIEEGAQISAGSTIIDHIKIGKNSIVAAGSLVKNDVPDNVMVAGVPAIIKKHL